LFESFGIFLLTFIFTNGIAKEFIQAILVLEPTERPTAADCLQAPWIVSQVPSKNLSKVNTGLSDYNTKRKQQINVV
jgi:hypothetical protein